MVRPVLLDIMLIGRTMWDFCFLVLNTTTPQKPAIGLYHEAGV